MKCKSKPHKVLHQENNILKLAANFPPHKQLHMYHNIRFPFGKNNITIKENCEICCFPVLVLEGEIIGGRRGLL